MSKSDVKRRKIYLDYPRDRSKQTCLIHRPRHSSYECKVLGEFGFMYARYRPTKERRKELAVKNYFGRPQENNSILQHAVHGDILLEKEN